MNRIANQTFAIVVAILLTAASFHQVASVPAGEAFPPVEIA